MSSASEELKIAVLTRIANTLDSLLEHLRKPKVRKPLTREQVQQRRKAIKKRWATTEPVKVYRREDTESVSLRIPVSKLPIPSTTNPVGYLIGIYVKSWQTKYATKARPNVTKAIGVLKKILEERNVSEVAELIQVYCQMEDKWFATKHHDIVTFGENIGKVAVAHDKGHERPNGEKHWTELAKERGHL